MTSSHLQQSTSQDPNLQWTQIESSDRWQIYFRLRELDIMCQCRSYQPLKVQIKTVGDAIQAWSVIRHCSKPRLELAQWLNYCLQL